MLKWGMMKWVTVNLIQRGGNSVHQRVRFHFSTHLTKVYNFFFFAFSEL